jgi:CheY-like chemotaxis protein
MKEGLSRLRTGFDALAGETGGRHVAKILVADDNSNVQKTVALALADLGVEIVAVNNGEAAVRKLSDISPDLVLADIFMPVRNGYEVCEYVKKDARFSRVPVVLLVGAFDPFDEREAQRVGADGILKKPFVPPEPLITMVKTLLDRSLGERLVAVSVSKPEVAVHAKPGGVAVAEIHAPAPEIPLESSNQEFPPPIERVAFGEGERPVAFGQLLETPVQNKVATSPAVSEPVDDDQVLTSSRPATLGDPIFWRNEPHEAEIEPVDPEETPSLPAESRTWQKEEDAPPHREESNLLQPVEPAEGETLELVRDGDDSSKLSVVDSKSILLDPATQSPLTVDPGKPVDLAANPLEWMATAPPENTAEESEATPGWDEPIAEATDTIDNVESLNQPLHMPVAPAPSSAQISAPVVAVPVPAPTNVVIVDKAPVPSAPARATPVPPAIPVPATMPLLAAPPMPPAPPQLTASVSKPEVVKSVSPESVMDTARSIPVKDWADLTASIGARVVEPAAHQNKSVIVPAVKIPTEATVNSHVTPADPAKDTNANPELVEAVVQRVLDKMRPQVVDIITKEFLRPIVQALVNKEIEK